MFMGEHQHAVDGKGRLIMPVKFREDLGESFIVTRGLENCLFVYPLPEWHLLTEKLKALSFTRADARAFMRLFFAGAVNCELDRQGRILLPNSLREHAKLIKDVMVIGVSSRVEIWSREVWDEYSQQIGLSYEDIAEKINDFAL